MSTASDPRLPLSFSGASIDRGSDIRQDTERLAALLAPAAEPRAIACDDSGVLVDADDGRLARVAWNGDPGTAILLGIETDGRALLGLDVRERSGPEAPERSWAPGVHSLSLREAGTMLPGPESGLAAYLVALMNWHRRHPFCSVCGSATAIAEAGLVRRCPDCQSTHFPRTDPVVIMSVESEGRLLLGSRAGWPENRFSVLAGFVSSGEIPEDAVIREVAEESGIEALAPAYVTSQPWPFPASLMLGFHAAARPGDPRPGADGELSDVRWFSRQEVAAMQSGESELQLPGEVSIARWLIDRWLDG